MTVPSPACLEGRNACSTGPCLHPQTPPTCCIVRHLKGVRGFSWGPARTDPSNLPPLPPPPESTPFAPKPMDGHPTHLSTSGGFPPQKANMSVHPKMPAGILTQPLWQPPPPGDGLEICGPQQNVPLAPPLFFSLKTHNFIWESLGNLSSSADNFKLGMTDMCTNISCHSSISQWRSDAKIKPRADGL